MDAPVAPLPSITMEPIESSQIDSIGYDPATQTLAIEFKRGSGAHYRYSGFSAADWQAFRDAESQGSHFFANIKGAYPFVKIPAASEAAS